MQFLMRFARHTVQPPQHLQETTLQPQSRPLINIISKEETTFYVENGLCYPITENEPLSHYNGMIITWS